MMMNALRHKPNRIVGPDDGDKFSLVIIAFALGCAFGAMVISGMIFMGWV